LRVEYLADTVRSACPRRATLTRNKRRLAWLTVLLSLTLVAAACGDDDEGGSDTTSDGGDGGGDVSGSIAISGSSTVEPVSNRVKELFEDQNPDVAITVDGPGTSDGFELFCQGQTDISDASRAIDEEEIAACEDAAVEFIEIPIAYDGLSVMLDPDNPLECLDFVDLYALFGPESDDFDSWDQVATLAGDLGSETDFSEVAGLDLEVIAPGTESGTYGSFIEVVLEDQATARADAGAYEPEGEDDFIRTDYPGQAVDEVIVEGISGTAGAAGWVGFAFADLNREAVNLVAVSNLAEDVECTDPTIETIADASYPASRTLYIYVNAEKADSNPALAPFVDFYLGDAYEEAVARAFGDSGYVVLPDDVLAESVERWESRTTGAA
jgi:phosphate transport system substrate-binding protein